MELEITSHLFTCFVFFRFTLAPIPSLQVMHSLLNVELPLLQSQLRDIDAQLKKAEESLNWNSQGQTCTDNLYIELLFSVFYFPLVKGLFTYITKQNIRYFTRTFFLCFFIIFINPCRFQLMI